jgi:hypothetical protein
MIPRQGWFLKEFSVQLQKEAVDPRSIQAAAASIVSRQPRSFELSWDGSEFRLFFGSSTPWDLDFMTKVYNQHVMIGLPAERADFLFVSPGRGNDRYPAPGWLPKLDPSRAKFFFVGNELGHCFAVLDTRKTGVLMAPLLLVLQRSRFAWAEFEWFEADLRVHLGELKSAMFLRWRDIDTPIEKTSTWTDSNGMTHSYTKKYDHPEKYGEFHSSHDKLRGHIESKMGSRLAAMIVRGVVDIGSEEGFHELPFSMIEDSGEVRRGRWLDSSHRSSSGGDSRLGDALKERWSDDPRMLLDMVTRRVFDIEQPMESFMKDYLPWRHSLPFVILGREEVGLLIHPPSTEVSGLKTTRRSELPPPTSNRMAEKRGIQIAGA